MKSNIRGKPRKGPVRPKPRSAPKKKSKQQPTMRRRVQLVPRPKPSMVSIQECTLRFIKAMTNPFGSVSGACIPTYPSKPSMKVRTFVQADGVIGTAGVGFAVCQPVYDNTTTSVVVTNATFAGNAFAVVGGGLNGSPTTNCPFTVSDLTSASVQCRTVAVGMRIVYTGTNLNMSGMTTCIVEPDHNTLVGKTAADLLAYGDRVTRSDPVTRRWCAVVATPISASDLQYSAAPYSASGAVPFLGIFITGVPGQTFRVEMYHHFEAIGVRAVSPTDNALDPGGTQMAIAAVSKTLSMPKIKHENWFTKAVGFFKEYISPVLTTALPLVASVI